MDDPHDGYERRDLHLLLNNKSLKFTGLSINIIGDNNIYLYLKGTARTSGLSRGISASGRQGRSSSSWAAGTPRFILRDAASRLRLYAQRHHGLLRLPKDDAFQGLLGGQAYQGDNYLTLKYIEPVLTGAP